MVWKFFEIAKLVAISKKDSRSFLIATVGIRKDGVLVAAPNSPAMIKGDAPTFCREAHSEYKICRKLDKGATLYVVRISKSTGKFMLARPCETCQNSMKSHGVKKCYYTISNDEYGVMIFKNRKIKKENIYNARANKTT